MTYSARQRSARGAQDLPAGWDVNFGKMGVVLFLAVVFQSRATETIAVEKSTVYAASTWCSPLAGGNGFRPKTQPALPATILSTLPTLLPR